MKNSKEYNKKNYKIYWGTPQAKKDRAARNTARNRAEAAWKVKKGDWKEVDHKKPLSKWWTNNPSNLRVVDRKTNRKWWAAIANKNKWSWYKKKPNC